MFPVYCSCDLSSLMNQSTLSPGCRYRCQFLCLNNTNKSQHYDCPHVCMPIPYLNAMFFLIFFPSPLLSLLPTAKPSRVSEVETVKEKFYICWAPAIYQHYLRYLNILCNLILTIVWPDGYYYCLLTNDKIKGERC